MQPPWDVREARIAAISQTFPVDPRGATVRFLDDAPRQPVPVVFDPPRGYKLLTRLDDQRRRSIHKAFRKFAPVVAAPVAFDAYAIRLPVLFNWRDKLAEMVADIGWEAINWRTRSFDWAKGDQGHTPRTGIPRRGWAADDGPSLFFPPGVDPAWLLSMTIHGLIKHCNAFSFGLPTQLADTTLPDMLFRDLVAPMVGLVLQRDATQAGCPPVMAYEGDFAANPPPPRTRLLLSDNELGGAWLVDRVLNGLAPAPLVKVGINQFEARYSFRGLMRAKPGTRSVPYVQPDVAVRLEVVNKNARLVSIRVSYDDSGATPPIEVKADAPDWLLRRAGRVAACAMFLSGQIDQHITRGHVLCEFIAVGVEKHLDVGHPIRALIEPRLAELTGVNRAADGGIWGKHGVLALCSALDARGLWDKMLQRLGGIDWKPYRPPSTAISDDHYAPGIFSGYWGIVAKYVKDALKDLKADDAYKPGTTWGVQTRKLFKDLCDRSAPFVPWDKDVSFDNTGQWVDPAEFATQDNKVNGGVFSPLDETSETTVQADVEQFATFAIFQATLGHSWPNVRQSEDAGDPEHAVICLKKELTTAGPPAAGQPDNWQSDAEPAPCDLAYQRGVGSTLTWVPVDTFDNERTATLSKDALPDPIQGQNSLAERTAAWLATPVLDGANRKPYPDTLVEDLKCHLSRPNR